MLIAMTKEEQALWDQICNYWSNEFNRMSGHSEKWHSEKIGEKQRELMVRLVRRDAIPAHRFAWLYDPEHVVGLSKSRWAIFCENFGASDERVFEHPHWFAGGYLPFLVGVINLPVRVVEEFRSDAEYRTGHSGYEMGMKYRSVAKSLGLTKSSAEEFQKLALDCGYSAPECRTIRDIIFKHLKK